MRWCRKRGVEFKPVPMPSAKELARRERLRREGAARMREIRAKLEAKANPSPTEGSPGRAAA